MRIRKMIRSKLFLSVLALVVIGVVAWVYFSKSSSSSLLTMPIVQKDFTEAVSVTGTVTAAKNVDLGFSQAGRIAHVYASVGDSVSEGAVLASIDNADAQANLLQKKALLQSRQAELAALKAGTRPEQVAITEAAVANDQIALAQARQSVIDSLKSLYTTADDAVHNKVDQFFNNPRSVNPQITFTMSDGQLENRLESDRLSAELTLIQWGKEIVLLSSTSDLSKATLNASTYTNQITTLLADANAALNNASGNQAVSQTTLSGYITNVAVARSALDSAFAALTSADTLQKSAASNLEKDQKTLVLQKAGSTEADIDAQIAAVAAAEADVESAAASLSKTIITAPFDGVVTRMDAKIGQVISPSDLKISMNSSGIFQIESYVPEVNIATVAVGNKASTTLDAYGDSVQFPAHVVSIDPSKTTINGVTTYKVVLQFLAADDRIKSGMTANVTIAGRTIANAIVIPRGAIYRRADSEYVQIKSNGSVIEKQIFESPMSVVGQALIVSGLKNGDELILNPVAK